MNTFRRRRAVVCQQLVEMITDYLEGGLDPVARAAVEAHLALCDDCNGYVDQVRRMLELTADSLDTGQVPQELLDTVTARFRRRH